MMKRGLRWPFIYAFLVVLGIATQAFAGCPLLTHDDNPDNEREFQNICQQIQNQNVTNTTISTATITNLTVTNFHGTATGSVIQSSCAIQTTQTTTTSNTYQSTLLIVTTAALRSTTSKVLILVNGTMGFAETAADLTEYATVFNGASNLANAQGMSSFDGTTAMTLNNIPTAFAWVDAPVSTSAQTYTVKIKNSDNAVTVRWNNSTGSSSMCVLEIGL